MFEDVPSRVPALMEAWAAKYKDKNSNYGNSWLLTGQTLALWFPAGLKIDSPRKAIIYGLITRMLDKMIRLANLELNAEPDKVGEQAYDTACDLGTYGFMTASVVLGETAIESRTQTCESAAP